MYNAIGYFTYSDTRRLIAAHKLVRPMFTDLTETRKRVGDIFRNAQLDPSRSKFYTLTEQTMIGLANAAKSSSDQPIYTFFAVLLNTCGRAPALPPRIGFRVDPSLSIAEAIWSVAVSYIDLGKFKTYLPPSTTSITVAEIADGIYNMVEDLDRWATMITSLEWRMDKLVKHIGWKIKMGMPIDQFEKSLFLHADSLEYGLEQSVGKEVAKATLTLDHEKFDECGDPLVFTFADKLKSLVLPGPKFGFIPLLSTASPESLFVTYGPYPTKAVTSAGFTALTEPFTALKLKPISAPIVVTPEDHLLGLMTSGAFPQSASKKTSLNTGRANVISMLYNWDLRVEDIVRATLCSRQGSFLHTVSCPIIMDIPEVDLFFSDKRVQYKYNSKLLGRAVITSDVEGIIYEMTRESKQYGGGQSFRSSIDEFEWADISDVKDAVIATAKLKMDVVYSAGTGKIVTQNVDLDEFFHEYGDKIVRPAFAQYFSPPLHMLETPQPSAVDYMALKLGLTEFERLMSKRALTICFNNFILLTFFNKVPLTGVLISGTAQTDILIYATTALLRKE